MSSTPVHGAAAIVDPLAPQSQGGCVVVFGGSGFLGSHVVDALTMAGFKVRIFDVTPPSYLLQNQEVIIGDIMDRHAVAAAVQGADYVYNFAGIADIAEARGRPVDTCELNVLGNVNILEAARLAGVKRFVFASTVYVYSNSGAFYRASKQAAERFVETYYEVYNLPYTILRYGSLYGRRADSRNGIYRLLQSAIEHGEVVYDGDPESLREFIHVGDAARLSVAILGEAYANRHLILTGHERTRVCDVMRMIAEMLPQPVGLRFGEKRLDSHYVVTPYAFNPRLGHKLILNDHTDLGQGLLDCIAEYYEKRGSSDGEEQVSLLDDGFSA